MICAGNYLNNYKFLHSHPNTSILVFVNGNSDLFQLNSEIHDLNTRYNCNLHLPSTHLTLVQKGVHYSGSKIYNHLPTSINALSKHTKLFKLRLKRFRIEHSFYSLNFIN